MTASIRDRLTMQLKAFDEDAFVALANRGLLRRARKDLENLSPEVLEEGVERLVVQLAAQQIVFDARGPSHARCSCPASGVCQHVLAAALWLQRAASTGELVDEPAAVERPAEAPASLEALHQALLAISADTLNKHAGKAGYRWAWQYVADLEDGEVEVSGDKYIVISFNMPRVRMRYLGGGLESILADSDVKHLDRYQVAAVLAYRRAHGAELVTPEPIKKARTAQLDLGRDHEVPDDADIAKDESRGRLRAGVLQLIEESIEVGLSHLSSSIQERFSTLAVWSQGAGYYRLALLLRRLADHVELLLDRAAGADEQRLFDELTITYGLVTALETAEEKGTVPARLIGRARSSYESSDELDLIGLGASAWRSPAGYVGLTMILYSPKEGAFYSCTDARPEAQRNFNPRARYRAPGPWSGLGAPEQATGKRVMLSRPAVNAQGRLSASEETNASVQPAADMLDSLSGCTRWSDLRQLRSAQRSLLAEPQPMLDWVFLKPSRTGRSHFDQASQTLIWPVYDEEDCELCVEVVYSELNAHAIRRIEQLAQAPIKEGALIVAKLLAGSRLIAEPLSLVTRGSDRAVDALHFDDAPKQGVLSKWIARALTSQEHVPVTAVPSVSVSRPLLAFAGELLRRAETGLGGDVLRNSGALDRAVQSCAAVGLKGITSASNAGASGLLKLNFVRLQYERLRGHTEGGVTVA